jgi:MFS family permease
MWHGLVWFVAGLLIAGTAPVMGLLVAGRVVQGFGTGLLSVALYVIVGQAYPEALHRRIFAAFAAAWVVPSLVGPALAGLVVEHLGWRWVFLAVPALAVPAVLLVQPGLRAVTVPAGGRAPDHPPRDAVARVGWACGAAVSAALLHYGGQQRGPLAVGLVAVALAGLLGCAPRLLPAGFLRAGRGLPTVIGLRGLGSAAFVGAEVVIPLLLSSADFRLGPGCLTVGGLRSAGSWLRTAAGLVPGDLPRAGLLCIAVGIGIVALTVSPTVLVPLGARLGGGAGMACLSVLSVSPWSCPPPASRGGTVPRCNWATRSSPPPCSR